MCFNKPYENYNVPRNGAYNSMKGVYCLAAYFTDLLSQSGRNVYYKAYDYTVDFSEEAKNVSTLLKSLVKSSYDISIDPMYIAKATWDRLMQFDNPDPQKVGSHSHVKC